MVAPAAPQWAGHHAPTQAHAHHRHNPGPAARHTAAARAHDAATIGGAAGVGAVIGGIIGGKKGAIIGGSAGGAAGTGVVLSYAGEEIDIPSGAIFRFVLGQSIEIEMIH